MFERCGSHACLRESQMVRKCSRDFSWDWQQGQMVDVLLDVWLVFRGYSYTSIFTWLAALWTIRGSCVGINHMLWTLLTAHWSRLTYFMVFMLLAVSLRESYHTLCTLVVTQSSHHSLEESLDLSQICIHYISIYTNILVWLYISIYFFESHCIMLNFIIKIITHTIVLLLFIYMFFILDYTCPNVMDSLINKYIVLYCSFPHCQTFYHKIIHVINWHSKT